MRHPRQNGVNITLEKAKEKGWTPEKRGAKNRYLYLLPDDKRDLKKLIKLCKYNLEGKVNNKGRWEK